MNSNLKKVIKSIIPAPLLKKVQEEKRRRDIAEMVSVPVVPYDPAAFPAGMTEEKFQLPDRLTPHLPHVGHDARNGHAAPRMLRNVMIHSHDRDLFRHSESLFTADVDGVATAMTAAGLGRPLSSCRMRSR